MKTAQSIPLMIILSFLLILRGVEAQNCLNAAGEPVSWWVILKVPPTIGNSGHGYYDSNTKTGEFVFINKTIDL